MFPLCGFIEVIFVERAQNRSGKVQEAHLISKISFFDKTHSREI
jgi:hypothetical protein